MPGLSAKPTEQMIAVGTDIAASPRTDPSVRY